MKAGPRRSFRLPVWNREVPDHRLLFWAAFVPALVLLALLGLSERMLTGYIEPYIGGIVRGMATTGDVIVPRLNGHPYLEKPPLYYALSAGFVWIFHSLEPWVMRLPSLLLGLGTALGIAGLGRRLGSARGGIWAGWMLATSFLFFRVTHTLDMDAALTAFVTMAFGAILLLLDHPERNAGAAPWVPIALALAFLTKGPVGPAMVILPLAAWAISRQDLRLVKTLLRPTWGWAVGILLVLGWLAAFFHEGGWPFIAEAFLRNGVGRYWDDRALTPVTHIYGVHQHPVWFYLRDAPGNLLPWTLPWIFALLDPLAAKRAHRLPPWFKFAALAFLTNLIFLSLSFTKRGAYLLPLLPLTLLATGLWLDRNIESGFHIRRMRFVLYGTFFILMLAALGGSIAFLRFNHGKALGPALFALVFLAAGIQCVRWVRSGHPARAWHLALIQATVLFSMILLVVGPRIARIDKVLTAPFIAAKRMEQAGFQVYECALQENPLGYASVILGHDIPPAGNADQIRILLAQPEPVVVLVDAACPQELVSRAGGTRIDLAAGHNRRLEGRTTKLLVNRPEAAVAPYLPVARP